jgi:hypothetical protein
MSAAEFTLFIFLVAGTLTGLLDLHFVMRKLCRSLRRRRGDFTRCQGPTLVHAASAAKFTRTSVIVSEVSETALLNARAEKQTKSLTAKVAKKSRGGRKELHLPFSACFAGVLCGLCG